MRRRRFREMVCSTTEVNLFDGPQGAVFSSSMRAVSKVPVFSNGTSGGSLTPTATWVRNSSTPSSTKTSASALISTTNGMELFSMFFS
jgi:hypothetical protein